MRNNLRFLLFGAALLAGGTAWSQDHTIHVSGHMTPCDPALAGSPVEIVVYGLVAGPVSATATLNMNCYYSAELLVPDTAGYVFVSAPCGTGVAAQDSTSYFLAPAGTADVVIDLNCGAASCEACMQVDQTAPFTGFFTSCSSGGLAPYELLWDFSSGGAVPGDSVTMEFPGPGVYLACLNFWTADDCSQFTCEEIYVDDDGNISLDPPTGCEACISVTPVMNGNNEVPFQANFTDCSTGAPTMQYLWWLPNGLNSDEQDQTFTFPGPGVYGLCLDITDGMGCESSVCDTVVVDPNGGINTIPAWYDCLGVLWGPNTPGTACDDADPNTMNDVWTADCACEGTEVAPTDCAACFTVVQTAPFAAVLNASCSEPPSGIYTVEWDFNPPGPWQDTIVGFTFPAPGVYTICLEMFADDGCTDEVCHDIHVDDEGNVSLGPPAACTACIITTQATAPAGPVPFTAQFESCSTGAAPLTYLWDFGEGTTSTLPDPQFQYNSPGIHLVCLTIADGNGCTSFTCDTLVVGVDGTIGTGSLWYDCLGAVWGENTPGTACTADNGEPGIWDADCTCVPATIACEACFTVQQGQGGGMLLPFTASFTDCSSASGDIQYQWTFSDGSASTVPDPVWAMPQQAGWYVACLTITDGLCTSTLCDTIVVDSLGYIFDGPWSDCLGEPWGTANPGTPCTGSDGTPGTWADDCTCDTGVPAPCNAGFWVMQAWQGTDSTDIGPVPFELWVWNLSYGGTGNFQFLWDFGDGTTSTEPFPTHIYASSGPYMLCLTIADDAGCTDTYCEEISVDDDGFLGMAPDGGVRSTLTVNVLQEMPTHVPEQPAWEPGTLWPNPVDERLNLQLHSSRNGQVEISIISADGRTVRSERTALTTGANLLPMEVGALPAGVYLLHFTDGRNVATMRFVKQ